MKTTLGTLLGRQSKLADYLQRLVADSDKPLERASKHHPISDEDYSESDSIYSQADENENEASSFDESIGFTSIFQNHLIQTGILPAPGGVQLNSNAGLLAEKAGITLTAQAHIHLFLDRDSAP